MKSEIHEPVAERADEIATAQQSCCDDMAHQPVNSDIDMMSGVDIRESVKKYYSSIAKTQQSCCSPVNNTTDDYSKNLGYTEGDLQRVPEGSNLGLGCGNPLALSQIRPGDTVLDLGSGGGFDCFLAAHEVGSEGRVIGVDMTPEMIAKAIANKEKSGIENVEFRLGNIEDLPVETQSVDLVISNCVINLSPDKPQVFREAFRTLKPGGTLMISDIVLLKELPGFIRKSIEAYAGCIAGAALKDDYLSYVRDAGFEAVEVIEKRSEKNISPNQSATIEGLAGQYIESIKVRAIKPTLS